MNSLPLFCLAAAAALATSAAPAASPRDAQWKEVQEAVAKGLPRTAIEKLDPIYDAAVAEKAYGEATRALAQKIALEGMIEGNKPEERITRLEAELERVPEEMVPILEALLANWYWQYFEQNRWRFMQRTATAEAPGDDFTTWDVPRIFARIDEVFTRALFRKDMLRRTPVAAYSDVLFAGTMDDRYRPTLYDFVAHEALRFYTSGEQAAAKPQDTFELPASSPIFEPVEAFISWSLPPDPSAAASAPESAPGSAESTVSPVLKALRLYQELLRFHQDDADASAFVDVDLARLHYGYNTAVGDGKDKRYLAALKRFVDQWADHEIASLALLRWAEVRQQQGDLVEAHALASRGRDIHRDSVGGKLCHNLIQSLEEKSIEIHTERVWNEPYPALTLDYRNITNVYVRALATDLPLLLARNWGFADWLDAEGLRVLLRQKPDLEWSQALPPTADYRTRTATLPAPRRLGPGIYLLVASHRPDFAEEENRVSSALVWVTDLALIIRTRHDQVEGFVLDARSGEPMPDATIETWIEKTPGPATRTDTMGFFALSRGASDRPFILQARKGDQQLASPHAVHMPRVRESRRREQTLFFTDRALYRPGQIIQYKGICLGLEPEKNDYDLLARRTVTVVFRDPNRKEIARQQHQCNDFGSFAGSFNAPAGRLLGRMSLMVEAGPRGAAWVQVEEYKRPKFQVSLDKPREAPRLNDTVNLTGHAQAYTGAPIDGAQVRYRVVREVRYPWWRGWFRPRPTESQEIAHGTLETALDGSFRVSFDAKPDPKIPPEDEPTFHFSVYADVTDTDGETRSAQTTVHVGYTALEVLLHADDWLVAQQPVALRIATQTLDGEPTPAEGSFKVHRLKQPDRVQRPPLEERHPWRSVDEAMSEPDPSDPNNWELGEVAVEQGFTARSDGVVTNTFTLEAGVYRVMLETQDRFGKKVTARLPLQVLDPEAPRLNIRLPMLLAAPRWSLEPGDELVALWGTGYEDGRAFIELEHRHQFIDRYWTAPGRTQQLVRKAITEDLRGGFTLHITQVRENRLYTRSQHVDIPWTNKELEVSWEHFTSKLEPGTKETWTAVIRPTVTPDSSVGLEAKIAEMVATLYDVSLDQFLRHNWPERFHFFHRDRSTASSQFANQLAQFYPCYGQWKTDYYNVGIVYRSFLPELVADLGGIRYRYGLTARGLRQTTLAMPASALIMADAAAPEGMMLEKGTVSGVPARNMHFFALGEDEAGVGGGGVPPSGPALDLSQVSARKNLNETAFFFPQLTSDTNGVVRLTFTMPEALTEWRFLGFAHDRLLRSGYLEAKTVTAKDIMVQPNPPRFLREGDTLEFTVKVSNQSATRQSGKVRLTFTEVQKDLPADDTLGNRTPDLDFDIPAQESRSFAWRIAVPDGLGFLSYKAVASTGRISDGEEGYLPVLARRVFVTESLPLPIRGPATNRFSFERLKQSAASDTLEHQNLVVQMVSNPAWYAVLALPYLMEFPHECNEQVFNRLYANALARFIANRDPKIRAVFDQWRNTPALDSPLEKNQDLKSVLIEETPWLRQAQNESQARRNVGVLFDDNRLNYEIDQTLRKLTEAQLEDGSWPWFPGGRGNDYITLYITTGFGRLRHLGADIAIDPAIRSLDRLDAWIDRIYQDIVRRNKKDENHLNPTVALYLYGRSFFLRDKPIQPPRREAVDYFLGQARKFWLELGHRQSQGHLAIALKRFGDTSTPQAIMRSLKERSVTSDELGRFWRDTERSWWWYRAPIETQALMIEAFDEVQADAQAVEDCKVWLLKQKQTQDWKTTKATADAVYALLLRGADLLSSDTLVEVQLGTFNVTPESGPVSPRPQSTSPATGVEPGTGFYEKRFAPGEIRPELGDITVRKPNAGVSWGSVHWQYLEDMNRVTPYEGTPLTLNKTLYSRVNTATGKVLQPVDQALQVGDELIVRLELRVDRDMEYVHLKDQRASGTEPVNVLSGYRYQDGLGYYESTRDAATHFFIDYLPKGTYIFEYPSRIQHRGRYQTGMASIQCMYAPEFNSHSQSHLVEVR